MRGHLYEKIIAATLTLSLLLSLAALVYADEVSNQEATENADNNSDKSITMYYGDFDYDGNITLKDAKKALQLAVGINTGEDYKLEGERSLFWDVDGDGNIFRKIIILRCYSKRQIQDLIYRKC